MAHAGKRIQRLATHAAGGRIGAEQFGVGRFQGLQALEQAVVFGIGNQRFVQHVVVVGMPVELACQAIYFDSCLRFYILLRRLILLKKIGLHVS